ncbi:hypothetical protein ACFHYQ_20805 [Sphaerimonospora cavernae]|uniref:Uncharacterized protein n=1 Tax=Sphaerimonospora cavernae TaxID=1740611 RepID=A0ABV6U978_9ACTN
MGYPGDPLTPRQPPAPPAPAPAPSSPPPPSAQGTSPYGNASPYGNTSSPYGDGASPYGASRENPYGNRYETPWQSPGGGPPEAGQEEPGESSPYAGRRRGRPDQAAAADRPLSERTPSPRSGGPEWDPYAPAPLWRRPVVLGCALLALIGALFLGLWVAARSEKPPAPRALPTPTLQAPEAPKGKYGFAGSRATDKMPLTLGELFGDKKFGRGGRAYVMTVRRKEKTCTDGVSGEKIQKALKTGRCAQLIRASFADAKGTIIGTVGVANLTTSAHAKKVTSAGGGAQRTDYLKPLPGKDDATKHLGGAGDAYAGGWAYGHYAVLLWFQFKDGHKPTKAEQKQLYQAAADIADKTIFPALEHRSLTGRRT